MLILLNSLYEINTSCNFIFRSYSCFSKQLLIYERTRKRLQNLCCLNGKPEENINTKQTLTYQDDRDENADRDVGDLP